MAKNQIPVVGGIRKVVRTPPTQTPGTTIAEFGTSTVTLAQLRTALGLPPVTPNTIVPGGSINSIALGPGLSGGGPIVGAVHINLTAPIPSMMFEDSQGHDDFTIPGPQGVPGTAGIQGRPGFDGDPGDDGDRGPPGLAGVAGATGSQGPMGNPGQDGSDGNDGDIGPPGATGPTGPQGIQGFIGVRGWDGDTGDDGDRGPPGIAGASGLTGAQGPTGPALFMDSDPGFDGDIGPPGPTGPTGPQGPAGSAVYQINFGDDSSPANDDVSGPIDLGISPKWGGQHEFAGHQVITANALGIAARNASGTLRNLIQLFSDNNVYLDATDGMAILRSANGITINAPTNAVSAMVLNAVAGTLAFQLNGAAGDAARLGLVDGNTGNRDWQLRSGGSATGTFDVFDAGAGISRFSCDTSGNITVNATGNATYGCGAGDSHIFAVNGVTVLSVNNGTTATTLTPWRFDSSHGSGGSAGLQIGATTATTATTGAVVALPALALGFLSWSLNGTTVKIPYFAN